MWVLSTITELNLNAKSKITEINSLKTLQNNQAWHVWHNQQKCSALSFKPF